MLQVRWARRRYTLLQQPHQLAVALKHPSIYDIKHSSRENVAGADSTAELLTHGVVTNEGRPFVNASAIGTRSGEQRHTSEASYILQLIKGYSYAIVHVPESLEHPCDGIALVCCSGCVPSTRTDPTHQPSRSKTDFDETRRKCAPAGLVYNCRYCVCAARCVRTIRILLDYARKRTQHAEQHRRVVILCLHLQGNATCRGDSTVLDS